MKLIFREVRTIITVKNNKGGITDVFISGDIVDDRWKGWGWGDDVETYPEDIRNLLKDSKGDVNVYISSGGGDFFAGTAISNILGRYDKGHVKAIIDSSACSAASIIAFGCDTIEMPANAYLMIHKPSITINGDSEFLLKWADTLDTLQEGMVETYMAKAKEGVTKETINNLINAETWFTGEKASEFFNVNIVQPQVLNFSHFAVENYANVPGEITKQIENKSEESSKEKQMAAEIEMALLKF